MSVNCQRILTVQDISCVGQCSMTMALPVLSACGHETCVLPTAILSTHTGGFSAPIKQDLTGMMPEVMEHWEREGIDFDAIYTGYLSSSAQIDRVQELIARLKAENGVVIVDPVMGDHGKLYKGFDESYVRGIIALCAGADIIIPNITEACMMTGHPYLETYDQGYIAALMEKLSRLGAGSVVLTGVSFDPAKTGVVVLDNDKTAYYAHSKIPKSYHGTGDLFAAALVGSYARGKNLIEAVRIAADFVTGCIRRTFEEPAHWYGVRFEEELPQLIERLK